MIAGAGPDGAAPGPFVVERGQRLSRSLLWDLQRRYFDQAGVDAWRTGAVPHYVTNNPALARAYAQVFLGLLRDRRAAGAGPEPLTIVELGAGSGRFAHLFLGALGDLLRRAPLAGARFRYVATDFTEKNVGYVRAHPALAPFVAQGVLDFAVFDAEKDREIRLLHAGTALAPGGAPGPLGVIANYVLDGISQDALRFEGGRLHECLVSLTSADPAPDLADPALLGRLEIRYERRPAPLDYYGDPAQDAIVRGYARRLEGRTVLFPSAAIGCIRRLADLAGGRLVLLSGDRGDSREDEVGTAEDPLLSIHGSFSLPVNYHAIAEYVRGRGGQVLETPHRHAHLHVSAFLLGEGPSGYGETRFAYEEAIGCGGPDDWFSLRIGVQRHYEAMDLASLLALLRLTQDDPRILRDCLPALWAHREEAGAAREILRAVTAAWERYYPIGEEPDLAFELALLAHAFGGHAEAIHLFRESARLHGDDPRTRWNMGLCHYAGGDLEAALACFEEAGRLAPGFAPSGGMQRKG